MEKISGELGAVAIAGLLTVFGLLALISLLVAAFRRLDDHWQRREARAEEEATRGGQTIDTTTLVLIAAAAATVATGRFRVRRIRRLLSPHTKRTPWSAQGRLILQGSHALNRSQKKR